MPHTIASKSIVIGILAGAVYLAAVTFVTVTVLAPRSADATVAMAKKTGKPCGACHKNPRGGGPLK